MNFREGFPSKYQLDFILHRLFLNFGDPFARVFISISLGNEKKAINKYPLAKKETLISENISFLPILYECSVNKFNDSIVHIEVILLKKENQRFVGDLDINLAEFAPKVNKLRFEQNMIIDLNNSSHYNGKMSFTLKLNYMTKKQMRSLSHNGFESKEPIILPLKFSKIESPKRAISNNSNNSSSHQMELIVSSSNYNEKTKKASFSEAKKSSNTRISIIDLENNQEDHKDDVITNNIVKKKFDKEIQTEEIIEKKLSFEEKQNSNANNNTNEEEFAQKIDFSNQLFIEKEKNLIKLSTELVESQKNESLLKEKIKLIENFFKEESEMKDSQILALNEEKNKISIVFDQERMDFLRKYNSLMEDLDEQGKKETSYKKQMRTLEENLEESKNSFLKQEEILKENNHNLELYNENLKKQLINKEKKLSELEDINNLIQKDFIKTKQKLADVINIIFERGGVDLMESIEAILDQEVADISSKENTI